MEILAVENLSVSYDNKKAVDDISFSLEKGSFTALIGESGAGKSTIASAILNLLPEKSHASGKILYSGIDILSLREKEAEKIRGKKIALIPQSHMASLSPYLKVSSTLIPIIRKAFRCDKKEAMEKAGFYLRKAGFDDPETVLSAYPETLSGGMRQRILIASALLLEPEVIIADEITSALDAPLRKEIMKLIADLSRENGITVLMITHDIESIRDYAERIMIMKDGRIIEQGTHDDIFLNPVHPYTRQLVNSVSGIETRKKESKEIILNAVGISKSFRGKKAVSSMSLYLRKGEVLGIAGMSGCGKTTLLKILGGIETSDNGIVASDSEIGMVFQDTYSSLDPMMDITAIVSEALRIRGMKKKEAEDKARKALRKVGLDESLYQRGPNKLSGGERQRVQIARALVFFPDILLLDEPLSSLDATTAEGILSLLSSLRKEGCAMIIVSHDMKALLRISDRIMIMKNGEKAAEGTPEEIIKTTDSYVSFLLS